MHSTPSQMREGWIFWPVSSSSSTKLQQLSMNISTAFAELSSAGKRQTPSFILIGCQGVMMRLSLTTIIWMVLKTLVFTRHLNTPPPKSLSPFCKSLTFFFIPVANQTKQSSWMQPPHSLQQPPMSTGGATYTSFSTFLAEGSGGAILMNIVSMLFLLSSKASPPYSCKAGSLKLVQACIMCARYKDGMQCFPHLSNHSSFSNAFDTWPSFSLVSFFNSLAKALRKGVSSASRASSTFLQKASTFSQHSFNFCFLWVDKNCKSRRYSILSSESFILISCWVCWMLMGKVSSCMPTSNEMQISHNCAMPPIATFSSYLRKNSLSCPYWRTPRLYYLSLLFFFSPIISLMSASVWEFSILSLRRLVTAARAEAMKLTKTVPTMEQSGMQVYVPQPVQAISAKRPVSSSYPYPKT